LRAEGGGVGNRFQLRADIKHPAGRSLQQLARAQVNTIRLEILKIGTVMRGNARRL
jgi:hypothetical protein